MANKKAALVCNNYKVKAFKKALIKAGYNNFTITPLTEELEGTTNIAIVFPENQIADLTLVIKLMELNYKTQN
ncbi:MAG: hypothetical protein IID03_12050 [Candidatus Dadabacteria bacterium]|nr:hypothetical protein [Candidatus Dadabacteria bacterium]